MANQIWEVSSSEPAKVWKSIGGARVYPDLVKGTRVTISALQGDYLVFLNGNVSKKIWFKFISDIEPPSPDPEPTVFVTHKVDVYNNGKIGIDGGVPF